MACSPSESLEGDDAAACVWAAAEYKRVWRNDGIALRVMIENIGDGLMSVLYKFGMSREHSNLPDTTDHVPSENASASEHGTFVYCMTPSQSHQHFKSTAPR
jgi:hypothetical protein